MFSLKLTSNASTLHNASSSSGNSPQNGNYPLAYILPASPQHHHDNKDNTAPVHATPPTSPLHSTFGSRKIRRRAGSLNLKGTQEVPSQQQALPTLRTKQEYFPRPSTSSGSFCQAKHDPTLLGDTEVHQDFAALPSPPCDLIFRLNTDEEGRNPCTGEEDQHLKGSPPRQSRDLNNRLKLRSVSSEEAAAFYRSSPTTFQQLVTLKQIKRLPHRQVDESTRNQTLPPGPPFRDRLFEEHPTASAISVLSTNVSSISLSQFPKPPLARATAVPDFSDPAEKSAAEKISPPQAHEKTPVLYFFRGASFNILNPHHSFDLEKIEDETPAEVDLETKDYFARLKGQSDQTFQLESLADMASITKKGEAHEERSTTKSTPQRSLFDDLPSAYNSITSRSARKAGDFPTSVRNRDEFKELPLPPIPAPSKLPTPNIEQFAVEEPHPAPWYQLRRSRTERKSFSAVFKKRLSSVFSGRKSLDRQSSTPTVPSYYNQKSESKDAIVSSKQRRDELSDLDLIFGYADGSVAGKDIETARCSNDVGLVPARDEPGQHYYDDESMFASSLAQDSSVSLATPTRSGNKNLNLSGNLQQETSNGNLIDMYDYTFNEGEKNSEILDPATASTSALLQIPRSMDSKGVSINSTIGEILDQYHRSHSSSSVPPAPENSLSCMSSELPITNNSAPNLLNANMARFDFAIYNPKRRGRDQDLENQQQHVRQATARALQRTPYVPPPDHSLPSDPSYLTPQNYVRDISGLSDQTSFPNSELDTRKLLLLSDVSVEQGRGSASLHPPDMQDEASIDYVGQNSNTPQSDPTYKRQSLRSEPDDEVTRDIKYLHRISGLSNITGSVFVLRNSSSLPDQQGEMEWNSQAEFVDQEPVQLKRIYSQRYSNHASHAPIEADYAPIAAFDRNSVVPGFLRFSPKPQAFLNPTHAPDAPDDGSPSSITSSSSGEIRSELVDEQDWETIPESRPTLKNMASDKVSSLVEDSSHESLNTFRHVGIHPGDDRFQHSYRLHRSPSSPEELVLMPSYDFRDGTGFPHRNALMPPNPAIYTYRHPVPLPQSYPNPFTSSPPQLDTEQYGRQSTSGELPCIRLSTEILPEMETPVPDIPPRSELRLKPLSVVHEQTRESHASAVQANGHARIDSIPLPTPTSNFDSSHPKSLGSVGLERVANGYSPLNVSNVALHGSPIETARQSQERIAISSSGLNAAIVKVLRKDDPRMASSPLSHSNSFNKLSHLGPLANITGTPNGTGMQEAGSSLVGDNSSPPFHYTHSDFTALPRRRNEETNPASLSNGSYPRPSLFVRHITTPLVNYNMSHGDDIAYHDAMQQTRIKENITDPESGPQDRLLDVTRSNTSRYVRPSVSSQRGLLNMTLVNRKQDQAVPLKPLENAKSADVFNEYSHHSSSESRNGRPVLPRDRGAHASFSSPRIIERCHSPSSFNETLARQKQRLSWVVFAVLCFLPPLLVVFGHGYMDNSGCMLYLSKGEISHFGRRQKLMAKWVGYALTISFILAITVALVIVETVPTDLS